MKHPPSASFMQSTCLHLSPSASKRKRKPAGTPDPDAEVVALSPKTLMEAERYVCEICKQGFQRDQNLQMHRRRHKVPWKLLKRVADDVDPPAARMKRVYVCPEPSCLHHDPSHALGDLVGIKKHYRRKHSSVKQWECEKCCKAYAVQSDYKAHLKTCGTRGHCCQCGRVFSRVESFIEHQDKCAATRSIQDAGVVPSSAQSTSTSMPTPDAADMAEFDTTPSNARAASSGGRINMNAPAYIEPMQPHVRWNGAAAKQVKKTELQLLPYTSKVESSQSSTAAIRMPCNVLLSSTAVDNPTTCAPPCNLQLSIGLSQADHSIMAVCGSSSHVELSSRPRLLPWSHGKDSGSHRCCAKALTIQLPPHQSQPLHYSQSNMTPLTSSNSPIQDSCNPEPRMGWPGRRLTAIEQNKQHPETQLSIATLSSHQLQHMNKQKLFSCNEPSVANDCGDWKGDTEQKMPESSSNRDLIKFLQAYQRSSGSSVSVDSDAISIHAMAETAEKLLNEAREKLRRASAEKLEAKKAWKKARRERELAEAELASAQRITAHDSMLISKNNIKNNIATMSFNDCASSSISAPLFMTSPAINSSSSTACTQEFFDICKCEKGALFP